MCVALILMASKVFVFFYATQRPELAAVLVFYNVQPGAAADLPAGRQVEKLMMKIPAYSIGCSFSFVKLKFD
ncbi:MAG: hypothetical protein IPH18_17665 [Chitinophagaceae bacterium]|nr:hypothetical protein [Chitinophagaceae bacterium]